MIQWKWICIGLMALGCEACGTADTNRSFINGPTTPQPYCCGPIPSPVPLNPTPPPGTLVQAPPISVKVPISPDQFSQAHALQKFNLDGHQGINVHDGSWAVYDQFDFGSWAQSYSVDASLAPGSKGATVEVHLDSLTGPAIGSLDLTPPSTAGAYEETTAPLSNVTGIHNLIFIFHSKVKNGKIGRFDMFTISSDGNSSSSSGASTQAVGNDYVQNSGLPAFPVTLEPNEYAAAKGIQKFKNGVHIGIRGLTNKRWVMYRGIQLDGLSQFMIDADIPKRADGSVLELHIDSDTGPLVTSIQLSETSGQYSQESGDFSGLTGAHDLYLIFQSSHPGMANVKIDSISLN